MYLILLSGGSGTRLWPLSNEARSKQFLKVLRDAEGKPQSMVQRVYGQIRPLVDDDHIIIATCASQEAPLRMQLGEDLHLTIEPERRDTMPAILLACAHILFERDAAQDETIVVMPIDTYAEQEYYDRVVTLDAAVQGDLADVVLLGAQPSCPSMKFGYIVPDTTATSAATHALDVMPVSRFQEKPSQELAESLIAQGALWNCGVFAFKLAYIASILAAYTDASTYQELLDDYRSLPKTSFDYGVLEKASSIAVTTYDGLWKDLGTWATLTEEMDDLIAGRVITDDACVNTHIINELNLPLVALGVKDSVIVATPDGILVSDKERSATLKDYAAASSETRPMYESRFWGEYQVLDHASYANGDRCLTKNLIVAPGKQISYQRHSQRKEVWTIVEGVGEVVLEGKSRPVGRGDVIIVEPDMLHAVRAGTDGELRIVEVQLGPEVDEGDIERFGNFWE